MEKGVTKFDASVGRIQMSVRVWPTVERSFQSGEGRRGGDRQAASRMRCSIVTPLRKQTSELVVPACVRVCEGGGASNGPASHLAMI